MKTVIINQSELTSDCWAIQFRGLEACEECEYKDTSECGGKAIIKRISEGKYPATGIGVECKSENLKGIPISPKPNN